jgi:hypothetical protein
MTLPAKSQNVIFNAYFDSLHIDTKEMRIGEHARFIVELSVDSGYEVEVEIPEALTADVEVLDKKIYRSTDANGRQTFRNECIITSFLDTLQVIPPVLAKVNDDIYYTNPTNLWVNSIPIDTLNLKNIKGFRPVWDVELTWNEYRDTVYLSFLLLVLLALLTWIIIRYINNKPIIRIVREKPRKPSHFTALQKIDEIKSDSALHMQESAKDYYTRLTDALREYMYNRYKFNAADMTTGEIIENLLRFNDKEAIREVKEILEVADLVKFAKLQPSLNENDRNMLYAIDFVNATKDVEEENLKPVEKKIVNERSLTQKRWLIASIAVVFCVIVAVAALLITDLGHLIG